MYRKKNTTYRLSIAVASYSLGRSSGVVNIHRKMGERSSSGDPIDHLPRPNKNTPSHSGYRERERRPQMSVLFFIQTHKGERRISHSIMPSCSFLSFWQFPLNWTIRISGTWDVKTEISFDVRACLYICCSWNIAAALISNKLIRSLNLAICNWNNFGLLLRLLPTGSNELLKLSSSSQSAWLRCIFPGIKIYKNLGGGY